MSAILIDVAVPDVPQREVTGAHRLQNLGDLVANIGALMDFIGVPLTDRQRLLLPLVLDSLLFGEQAP